MKIYLQELCLQAELQVQELNIHVREYSQEGTALLADHDYKPHKGVMPAAVYGEPQRVRFEDTELNGVAQPDVYLRQLYGNYMELPKELPPRNYRLLDLNKPWRQNQ